MAIDTLARGLAVSNSGGGGGSLDVGIQQGVGIKITGDDPKTISNDGVTNITESDTTADNGTIKVILANKESPNNVKHIAVKGLTNTAFTEMDTIVNETKKESTNVPQTKAVYFELSKKADLSSLGVPTTGSGSSKVTGIATLDTSGKLPLGQMTVHTHGTDEITELTNYQIATQIEEIKTTDTLNEALGKIQKTLNSKQDASKYAGATINGGAATSAEKLTNTAKIGNVNTPVYFTETGVPEALEYSIKTSVPENAVFTDTKYNAGTKIKIDNANNIINMGIRSVENSPSDANNGTFKIVSAKEDGTDKVDVITIKGINNAAYKDTADTLTETNWNSDKIVPTIIAVTTELDKKLNKTTLATRTNDGVMSQSDKNKLDDMNTFAGDEAMMTGIKGIFSGFDMSGIGNDDDDGISDPEDVEAIFDNPDVPTTREAETQGYFTSLSADEIDGIMTDSTTNPSDTTPTEPDGGNDGDNTDLDSGEIDNIL